MDLINGMEYNVRCRNFSAYKDAPKEIVFTGQVVASAPYDPPETFRMKSGNTTVPFRVISYANVISFNDRTFCYQAAQVEERKVQGSKGAVYTVRTEHGRTTCTCPGFQFRKTCKHISE